MRPLIASRSRRGALVTAVFVLVALLTATTTVVLLALLCIFVAGAVAWVLALHSARVARGDGGRYPPAAPWVVAAGWTLIPTTLPAEPGLATDLWVVGVVGVAALWLVGADSRRGAGRESPTVPSSTDRPDDAGSPSSGSSVTETAGWSSSATPDHKATSPPVWSVPIATSPRSPRSQAW